MSEKKILVLGVGNILLRDEGVGVRVVERLQAGYSFSPNVSLLDGGTLGIKLMDAISSSEVLIVVDAVLNGQSPGTFYRLTGEEVRKSVAFKYSLHQTDLLETLACCELVGNRPETVVLGIEPEDYSPWSDELTTTIQGRVSEMSEGVLREINKAGGNFRSREGFQKAGALTEGGAGPDIS
jgi:hydrogenase maturation protease